MVSTRRATDRKENLSVWLVPGEPQTEKKICQTEDKKENL